MKKGLVGAACILVLGVTFGLTLTGPTFYNEDLPQPYRKVSAILGWNCFFAWSVSFYPQVWLNYARRSVVGLSLDYELYNILGFTCLAVYTFGFKYDSAIQQAYADKHDGKSNLVAVTDVLFAIHGVVLTAVTIAQCFAYERGGQRLSRVAVTLTTAGTLSALVYAVLAATGHAGVSWLGFLYWLSGTKGGVTLVKYIPQVWMNYQRQSTDGWNIWNVWLDMSGGALSLLQLVLDAYFTQDWQGGITGDGVKLALGVFSILFGSIFLTQHFVLYRQRAPPSYMSIAGAHASPVSSSST